MQETESGKTGWVVGSAVVRDSNRGASALLALCLAIAIMGCGGAGSIGGNTVPPPPPTVDNTTLRGAASSHNLVMSTAASAANLPEAQYSATLGKEYTALEPENEMKFDAIHPSQSTYNYAGPDALVSFATSNSMLVRGHTLVWHNQLPGWVTSPATAWTTATLGQALSDHITTVVGHYKGKVYAWDVVNEAFNGDGSLRNTIWYNAPGIGYAGQGTKYIEQSLLWAHAADPPAKLFVNEYGAETLNPKSDAIYAMAQDFVNRGVPLSGIGMQLHIGLSFDNAGTLSSLAQNMQRLADLGLDVHFTEVDVALPDNTTASLTAQAKLYQDLLGVCLAQPRCKLFQTWGFTDKYSWIPAQNPGYGWALPFDANYAKKPAYDSMLTKLK